MRSVNSHRNSRAGVETYLQRVVEDADPYARIAFLFFNRNGQDRSLQFFIIHFSLFIIFGAARYGCAITPLSLCDISPNRGISSPPTRVLLCKRGFSPYPARKKARQGVNPCLALLFYKSFALYEDVNEHAWEKLRFLPNLRRRPRRGRCRWKV